MTKFLVTLIFLLSFTNHSLGQSNKSDLEKRRNSILSDISETENILSNTQHTRTESLEKLQLLDRKINLRNSVIENLLTESSNADKRIKELESTTDKMSEDINSIRKEYGHMIYLAYLNRNKNNSLMYILSASDFNQAYKRLLYIKQYSVYRRRQVDYLVEVQNELDNKRKLLEAERLQKLNLVEQNKSENLKLKDEVSEKTKIVNNLKVKEKELSRKLNEKNRIAEKLQREIENIVKAEIKRKSKAKVEHIDKFVNSNDNELSLTFNDNKGKHPWPVEKGIITNGFGEHPHPVYKNVMLRNNGIDISTKEGAEVKSIFSGEVTAVLFILGSNYSIIIRHGNFLSVYSNIVNVKVNNGDKVKTKQILGNVFTDDDSKSTVLHVEIWDELKKLNPEIWLSRR